MSRLAFLLGALGTFLAGAVAMAWWLTQTHDDRVIENAYFAPGSDTTDEPGGGWER